MPYRRRYRKRAKPVKKTVGSMTLPKLKTKLGINPPELKLWDVISSPTNISTTLSGIDFGYNVTQGLTNLTRIGRAIRIKSYQFRMTLYPNPAAGTSGSIRMIWIHQKYPNQSLQTPAATLQTVTNIHSPYQIDQSGFSVLYDKTFTFAIVDSKNRYLNVSLPMGKKGKEVRWSEADVTGNSANLERGYIRGFIMYAGFGGNVPSYDLYQRVQFLDS